MIEPRKVPGTVADRRWSTKNAAKLAVGFACIATFIYALYAIAYANTEARHGCERLDEVRAVEYAVLADAQVSLRKQADVTDDRSKRRLLAARATQHDRYLRNLRESVHPYGDPDETAAAGGVPHIDCSLAYPRPAPLSWFE